MRHFNNFIEEEWKHITTNEIAYFYGYLWADGHVNDQKFSFEIREDDFLSIWPILQKIGFIGYTTRKRPNSKNSQCCVQSSDKVFVNILKDFGFIDKSSSGPKKILKHLSSEKCSHFIRGYFDGDGCVSLDKNNLIRACVYSTYEYDWSFLENFCKGESVNYSIYRKIRKTNHKYSVFEILGISHKMNFLNKLYETCEGIVLKRKYEKYLLIIEKINHGMKMRGRPHKKDSCKCGQEKDVKSPNCAVCAGIKRRIFIPNKNILIDHFNNFGYKNYSIFNISYPTYKKWLKDYGII